MPPEAGLYMSPTACVGVLKWFGLDDLVNHVVAAAGDQLIDHGLAGTGVLHHPVSTAPRL
jgi:hypothetical protein